MKYRKVGANPTAKEIEEHELDHAVFKDWCPHCVKGKSVAYPHLKNKGKESEIPIIAIDYMFMLTDKKESIGEGGEEEKGMPTLVIKDSQSKMMFARVVPEKGVYPYAVVRLAADIRSLGYRKLIIKSDNEASIKALKEAARNELEAEVIMEEAAVGDHAGNGVAESSIRQVQGQFRAMKSALEEKYKSKINGEHQCIPWLMAHAAATINRGRRDESGMTASRRWKGRDFNRFIAEFGENVMYLKAGSVGKEKFGCRWERGIYLGTRDESGEGIIGTPDGVVRAKDFRRIGLIDQR